MSAKFDEFPSFSFQDIKEKPKFHGRTDGKRDGKMDGRTDNVKTVYPPIVCGGVKTYWMTLSSSQRHRKNMIRSCKKCCRDLETKI